MVAHRLLWKRITINITHIFTVEEKIEPLFRVKDCLFC